MANIRALFWPRSIALVGASPDKQIIRGRIVDAIQRHPYPGSVCAVSRSHQDIDGLVCYASVDDLPGAVDLAVITIPAEHVATRPHTWLRRVASVDRELFQVNVTHGSHAARIRRLPARSGCLHRHDGLFPEQ